MQAAPARGSAQTSLRGGVWSEEWGSSWLQQQHSGPVQTSDAGVQGPGCQVVSALPGFLWGVGAPSLSWEAVGTHGALTGRGCILA